MAGFEDILKVGAPLVGMGVGALAGGPAGAALGGAIGQGLGAGIGLLGDQPSIAGASPAQQALMGIQMRNLEKMQAMQGMSAQQVQNINQSTAFSSAQQQQQISNVGQANMSPIDRQNMVRGILNMIGQQGKASREAITSGDIKAEAARIASIGSQSAMAAQQAEAIRQAELSKQMYEKKLKDINRQNFSNVLGSIAGAATAFAGTLPTGEPTAEQVQQADIGAAGATSALPVADITPDVSGATKGIFGDVNMPAPGQNLKGSPEIDQGLPLAWKDSDFVDMFIGSA